MNVKNYVLPIPYSTLAASTFDGDYVALTDGLPQACFYLRINNATTVPISVSFDGGVTDGDFLSPGQVIDLNTQTNAPPNGNIALFAKGQSIYISGTVGTGAVYLSGYYQPTGTQ
jgi:hypothetical protein